MVKSYIVKRKLNVFLGKGVRHCLIKLAILMFLTTQPLINFIVTKAIKIRFRVIQAKTMLSLNISMCQGL